MLYFLGSLFYTISLPLLSVCALSLGGLVNPAAVNVTFRNSISSQCFMPQKSKNILLYIWLLCNTDSGNFCFSPEICFSIVFSTSLNATTMYPVSCSRHKPRNDSQFSSFPSAQPEILSRFCCLSLKAYPLCPLTSFSTLLPWSRPPSSLAENSLLNTFSTSFCSLSFTKVPRVTF